MPDRISSNDRVLVPSTEARKIAGFSRQHLQRLLRDQRIEGIKLAHDWLVYEDSLKAYLAQPRKPGPKGPRHTSTKDTSKRTPSESNVHKENSSETR